MSDELPQILERALSGDPAAKAILVREALGVVRVRVYRALVSRARGGRSVTQEVEDIAQETMCRLFQDDARILRTWDPARGLSVRGFIGLVAEREAAQVVRSGRRSPWANDPSESAVIEKASGAVASADAALASRDLFDRIWARLKETLSPKGLLLFQALLIEEQSVEDVCLAFQMQTDAVYAWRSRLTKRAREIAVELESNRASGRAALAQTVSKGDGP